MKKNIILYSFIALLSGTAGCSDMLDEYPLDAISPETYYNNADEVELLVNGKSQGVKRKGENEYHLSWRVRLRDIPNRPMSFAYSIYRPKYRVYAPCPHLAEAGTGNTSERSISI